MFGVKVPAADGSAFEQLVTLDAGEHAINSNNISFVS